MNRDSSSRKSRFVAMEYLPSREESRSYFSSLYTSMFLEDVASEVLPYSDKPKFVLTVSDPSMSDLIWQGLTGNKRHDRSDFELRQMFHHIVTGLLIHRLALYEIVYWTNSNGVITKFGFEAINPLTVKMRRKSLIQRIPAELSRSDGKRYYEISKEDVVMRVLTK